MTEQKEEFKHLVRIANTDIDGNKTTYLALSKIKGVSFSFANALCYCATLDKRKKVGYLEDDEIKKIEEVLQDPLKFKIPSWLFNRRKDYEDGTDKHLTSSDLKFAVENDIKLMKKIKSYKGIRHVLGLPVRGQRTKSNFRKNKGNVLGVRRRSGAKAGRV